MLAEQIPVWSGGGDALLECYRLKGSPELSAIGRRPAAIICPGGAYLGTSDREAEPVAMRFLAKGYHAFVLRYTTYYGTLDRTLQREGNPRSVYPQPLLDLAKAVTIVREHAEEWQVDPDQIVVVGFSAGGHLAASLGVHWQEPFLRERLSVDSERLRPNALVLGYALLDYLLMLEQYAQSAGQPAANGQPSVQGSALPQELEMKMELWRKVNVAVFGTVEPTREQLVARSPVCHVGAHTPPTFLWHTAQDDLVDARHSLRFAMELAKHGIPYELHVFEGGPHGLSLGDETTAALDWHINPHAAGWLELAFGWLKRRFGFGLQLQADAARNGQN
jgi:acetyl esterase/lipase